MGCISPVGNTVKETWKSLLEGKSGAGWITHFDASKHKTRFAAEVKGFDGAALFGPRDARKMDRYTQFAIAAAMEALEQSRLKIDDANRDRIGVLIGTGIGGIQTFEKQYSLLRERGAGRVSPRFVPKFIGNMGAGRLAMEFGCKGPNLCVVSACATGTHAIGEAYKLIASGEATAMLAGGAEAAITPLALSGFANSHALSKRNDTPATASRPFSRDRDGFVMGEGAGVMVIEEYEHARARGAQIYAEIVGYGQSSDAYHETALTRMGWGCNGRLPWR
jgi:3-oxoacyl-[acyl-carrier-protein] synthase II